MKLSVKDLIRATKGRLIAGYPTTVCEGHVSIDSRTLKPGDIFFALRGPRYDGHRFLSSASQHGAKAVVLERLDSELQLDAERRPDVIQVADTLGALQETARFVRGKAGTTKFIGLTGSNGKTTTKEMLASILRRVGKTLSTRGNLNNHIGLPLMLADLEADHQFAVLEMGTSKKGDMDLLVELTKPDVGLITNVGKDHLEFLGTPEGVLEVNRKLFDALPKNGIGVINLEDPLLKGFAEKLPCRTVTYGRLAHAQVRAMDIKPSSSSLRFTLFLGQEKCVVTLNLIGEVQVLNAMAAAAVAHALGVSANDIMEGLKAFKPVAMRMDAKALSDGTVLVNDAYNANPSSMRASIESFYRSYPDRPKWLVLGDMRELGAISRKEHEELGRWIASLGVNRIFLYGRDIRFALKGISSAGQPNTADRYRKQRFLIGALKASLQSGPRPAILFKASRSLKLERVTHALSSLPS